jgi:hypothetical protein
MVALEAVLLRYYNGTNVMLPILAFREGRGMRHYQPKAACTIAYYPGQLSNANSDRE